MHNLFSNKYLLYATRIVLGLIFVFAGAEKIADPKSFAISISNYRLLPILTINFFAITLPWIELVAGILLILGISVKENSSILFSMLLVFTIAITISLLRGLSIDCGCYGKGSQIGLFKIGENTLMLIGFILLMIFDSNLFKLKSE
jgi:uncharacterized membrane protein YphA (DoxX/SURF4 family)